MFDYLSSPLEAAHFADSSHVLAVPFHPELEILIGIEARAIYGKFSHASAP